MSSTQIVEIMGRNQLVNELLAAGFEVAEPLRDRGIDLIAYLDIDDKISDFSAVPIQLKAAQTRGFSIDRKYAKFPNMVIAFVWGIGGEVQAETYALTYAEAVEIANQMGYTNTSSWQNNGIYSSTRPSKDLLSLLAPYRMTADAWSAKLRSLI